MTEQEALEIISRQRRFHAASSLTWMRALMDRLGNPQDQLRYIHVTGTNGKGSTCTMLASVLEQAGYRTGKFISPYVLNFRERMQVNRVMISPKELVELVEKIHPVIQELEQEGMDVTEFEFVSAIAFTWFAQKQCDIVALEVGVGGLYDSTNVIPTPLASVITSISLDHTALLGDSIQEISREKGGIIKPGGIAVLAPDLAPEALEVLTEIALEEGSRLETADSSQARVVSDSLEGMEIQSGKLRFWLPLIGRHQVKNAVTALAVLEELRRQGWTISDQQIIDGMAEARFPARLEVLGQNPVILLDGAHNPAGITVLKEAIRHYLPGRKLVGLMGMMQDKDCNAVLQELSGLFAAVVTVTPDHPRAMDAADLARHWQGVCGCVQAVGQDFSQAVRLAMELAGEDGAVVGFGSLFLAANLRPFLLEAKKSREFSEADRNL
ncbi:MAG: bifunctional folylpolyglutamate synthase/dihydrofolate synthase [Clostridiales bacterium]|jgi:dihydrofolate synthase/folylpolyglutamate synthase|nr:bifunctional folylpolyglutamate synthase/dihydrofolate synthase [Clostridiales bacterium]